MKTRQINEQRGWYEHILVWPALSTYPDEVGKVGFEDGVTQTRLNEASLKS